MMIKTDTAKTSTVKLVQDINPVSFEMIKARIRDLYSTSVKIVTDPLSGNIDEQSLLIDYFRHIIPLHTQGTTTMKGRRTLTT
jgi:hypothetical protein